MRVRTLSSGVLEERHGARANARSPEDDRIGSLPSKLSSISAATVEELNPFGKFNSKERKLGYARHVAAIERILIDR